MLIEYTYSIIFAMFGEKPRRSSVLMPPLKTFQEVANNARQRWHLAFSTYTQISLSFVILPLPEHVPSEWNGNDTCDVPAFVIAWAKEALSILPHCTLSNRKGNEHAAY